MKINNNPSMYSECVFLGGTCATSTWRQELIPMLADRVPYFNPQLGVGEWNDEAAAAENACKSEAKLQVYVLTPEGVGWRSLFEMGQASAKLGRHMIFAAIGVEIDKAMKWNIADMREDGVIICETLEEVAAAVNACYPE